MAKYNFKQYVELFHLLLLVQLGQKLDKRFYALKGGCNLRFYLKSIRYSEDIDLDIKVIPKEKLVLIIDGILKSKPFTQILQVHGIRIDRWSKPKQTDTTQRWKMTIAITNSDLLLPTKIEFSRRGLELNTKFESVDPIIINSYQLSPIILNHYDAHSAYEQKIEALITRKVTQARDIFDLYMLINSGVDTTISDKNLRNRLNKAEENALAVTFAVFKSQVLSYLHPDYQAQYDSESLWDDIILKIMETLNKA